MIGFRQQARMSSAICLTVLTLGSAPHVAATTRCLTPDTGRVLRDVLATGAVQRRLPSGFSIENVEIAGQAIALSVLDPEQVRYELTLRVAPAEKTGRRRFTFAIGDGSHPPPRAVGDALVAAAGILDDAIPDALLADCSSSADDPGGRAAGTEGTHALRLPPALALVSAVAEVSIIVAAIVFSLAAIAKRPNPDGPR